MPKRKSTHRRTIYSSSTAKSSRSFQTKILHYLPLVLTHIGYPVYMLVYAAMYCLSKFPQIILHLRQIIQRLIRHPLWRTIKHRSYRNYRYSRKITIRSLRNTGSFLKHLSRYRISPPFSWKYFTFIFFVNLTLGSLIYGGATLYYRVIKDLPHPTQLQHLNSPQTSEIYDRNGILLYQIYQNQNREQINLSDLPDFVINAHLSIEDKNFFQHQGISVPDIGRAALNYVQYVYCRYQQLTCNPTLQGGSTITQQLLKNTLLTPQRNWERKLREAILAIWTERYFNKQQILEMYLNQISYGGTAYGIEAASKQYFNKPARDLNIAEAALLAGLPAAPSAYSPFGAHPERGQARQHQVLNRMLTDGHITQEQYQTAIDTPLTYRQPVTNIKAPHFVMYVKDQLEQQLGSETLSQGGVHIFTTIDLNLQTQIETILNEEVTQLQKLGVTNGAALVTRPSTGEILAMVGSVNYFDTQKQGNFNATTALRQPGSAIKPLMYATALSQHLPTAYESSNRNRRGAKFITAASLINDAPITYKIPGAKDYTPKNYDGKYHGRVSLRTALASSYNIPAVKTLDNIGLTNFISTAQDLGITTWNEPERYGLSITLGGAEVKMTDLAVAYGTLANLGIRQPLQPIFKMSSSDKSLQSVLPSPFSQFQNQILDPRVAYIINHILSDNEARSPAFGLHSKLTIPNHQVAVKTGTTNLLRDNWTIGYTPEYLVIVWVGNFDNKPMARIASGITGAAPIWNRIMTHLLNDYHPAPIISELGVGQVLGQSATYSEDPQQFPWHTPQGLSKISICPYTGTLPCNGCPAKEEFFINGTEPNRHCRSENLTPTPTPE